MKNLRLGIIQTNILWEKAQENRILLEKKIITLVKKDVSLIILPEMFTTGFSMNTSKIAETMQGETIKWMMDLSQKHQVSILGSLCIKEKNTFYNRLIITEKNKSIYSYDKKHLFSFGGEDKSFSAGKTQTVFSHEKWNIKTAICYDLRFPVWLKNKYSENKYEYDLLLVVANWPAARTYQWEQLLIARAIENQSFVVGVNRIGTDINGTKHNGNSLVISPVGEVIHRSQPNKEENSVVEITKEKLLHYRNKMNCGKDWDTFEFLNTNTSSSFKEK